MLNLEETKNRKMILELINEMPGIRYIELKRITGLAYGTLIISQDLSMKVR
jgi:predicted transcriptional regulator